MTKHILGQRRRDLFVGQVSHRDHIQAVDVVGRRSRPVARSGVAAALPRAAELFEDTERRVAATVIGEHPGHRRRRARITG